MPIHNAPMAIVGGVSGTGKTTVGAALARRIGWEFVDADEFHPPANVAKMRAGIPLNDADRLPWLETIVHYLDAASQRGQSVVVACSVLRRRYRDLLREHHPQLLVMLLVAPAGMLAERVTHRPGHFFPEELLASQLATLELPPADEDVPLIDSTRPVDQVVGECVTALEKRGLITHA